MAEHTDPYEQAEFVPRAEAARIARVSVSTLLRAEKAGRITPLRTPGGHRRYRRTDVEGLLRAPTDERAAS